MTFVLPALGPGGAERVGSILIRHWANRGWDVTVLLLASSDVSPFFALPEKVTLRPLGLVGDSNTLWDRLTATVRRVMRLRHAIREARPDIVVAFVDTTNVLTLLATRGLRLPVVVSERTDPRQLPLGAAVTFLRDRLYPRAESVVVQTGSVAAWAKRRWGAHVVRLANPVLPAPEAPSPTGHRVVAMGRLSHEKGFDRLLDLWPDVVARVPDATLAIYGEGPERENLARRVASNARLASVTLCGVATNAHAALGAADVFVLPSRFEGFPNALAEAMAAGRAVVAFDCPSGPADLITDGVDGRLVPAGDVAALGKALADVMADATIRERMGRAARAVSERFAASRICAEWDALLLSHVASGAAA